MSIIYLDNCNSVDWQAVADLFHDIGWGIRPPEILQAAFSKSTFVRFAYDGDQLIGMGRTVDDGAFYGLVVDLLIHPEYQNKGIGSKILSDLEACLSTFITTTLTAAPGKGGFYEKQGWLKQSNAYIYPRSEGKKRDYT